MTREELLKDRWEVIASFPDSEYKVGEIEDRDWSKYVNGQDCSDGVLWSISDFPHLFRKLEWWEKRDVEDLPDYVKYQSLIYKVTQKYSVSVICDKNPINELGLNTSWTYCMPSDENEYNESLKHIF